MNWNAILMGTQHVLIYGPPGVGKTAAARLILEERVAHFQSSYYSRRNHDIPQNSLNRADCVIKTRRACSRSMCSSSCKTQAKNPLPDSHFCPYSGFLFHIISFVC